MIYYLYSCLARCKSTSRRATLHTILSYRARSQNTCTKTPSAETRESKKQKLLFSRDSRGQALLLERHRVTHGQERRQILESKGNSLSKVQQKQLDKGNSDRG